MSVVSKQHSPDLAITTQRSWTLRRIVVGGLALLFGACLLATLWVPRSLYTEMVVSHLTSWVSRAGLNLVVQQPDIGFVSFSCRQADLFIPRIITTLPLRDVTARIDLLPLAVGTVELNANASIWNGSVQLSASYSLWSQKTTLNAKIQGVNLNAIVPLQALGVEQGTLSGSISDALLEPRSGSGGLLLQDAQDWSLSLTKAEKAQDTFFQLPRPLGGGFIAIPAFEALDISASGDISSGLLRARELTSSSSLGSLTASGEVTTASAPPTITLSGTASLSEKTAGKYGPFLPMISGNALTSEDRELSFSIRGPLNRTEIKLSSKQ